ncbi:hypothetical protein C4K37_0873 [Pseudomonas chlororaphis subsp. piscium]|nr:hypothetical protein C4K37_0873 [Pseudomonas chlororaphis subsp. piscium]AZC41820.1 hypothetical protein C4K36_0876 [Pseudomonas chlororaphis subsp. piscium]
MFAVYLDGARVAPLLFLSIADPVGARLARDQTLRMTGFVV